MDTSLIARPIKELPEETRTLLYLHIRSMEQHLTGSVSKDISIPYVKWRENTLAQLSTSGIDINKCTNKYGGLGQLVVNPEYCLLAIQKSLKGNIQRNTVRQLLWKFMDELEFDMHIDSNTAYFYKWDLVNQIIKNKLFG